MTIRKSSIGAIETFRADPVAYDLVFTGMTIPNMTDTQLAKHLMVIRADFPIIIYAGFSEKMLKDNAH